MPFPGKRGFCGFLCSRFVIMIFILFKIRYLRNPPPCGAGAQATLRPFYDSKIRD
jgi:hypothetical protein